MSLTPAQVRQYYSVRTGGAKFTRCGAAGEHIFRCPFHDDRTPSASVNFEKGGLWNCHACHVGGSLVDFEMRWSKCDRQTAYANVSSLLGVAFGPNPENLPLPAGRPTKVYPYVDEFGRLLYEALRYTDQKGFFVRVPDGKGGWKDPKKGPVMEGVRRVLYRLPEVITANCILFAEGEKDAETLAALDLFRKYPDVRVAATAVFGGTNGWRDDLAKFFAGKNVFIFEDNDDLGRAFALKRAQAILPFAATVRIVRFPMLPPKGDVTDFMEAGHTQDELWKLMMSAPLVTSPDAARKSGPVFVTLKTFLERAPKQIEWVIEDLMPRGCNGIIAAEGKAGKTYLTEDMVLAMALRDKWLGRQIVGDVNPGIVTREDDPDMTAIRFRALLRGRGVQNVEDVLSRIYINSRKERDTLMLDNPQEMAELEREILDREINFLVMDVFNVMHDANENDQKEMRRIMKVLSGLTQRTGCMICMAHHFKKEQSLEMNLVQDLRGSSAISGWIEWGVGLYWTDREKESRVATFLSKASGHSPRYHWTLDGQLRDGIIRVKEIEPPPSREPAPQPRRARYNNDEGRF